MVQHAGPMVPLIDFAVAVVATEAEVATVEETTKEVVHPVDLLNAAVAQIVRLKEVERQVVAPAANLVVVGSVGTTGRGSNGVCRSSQRLVWETGLMGAVVCSVSSKPPLRALVCGSGSWWKMGNVSRGTKRHRGNFGR